MKAAIIRQSTITVENFFSRDAPYDNNQLTLGFNPTFHNPYGKNFVFTASYKFK